MTVSAHYLVSREMLRCRVVRLLLRLEECRELSRSEILMMADRVVVEMTEVCFPFGDSVSNEKLLEIIGRLCDRVSLMSSGTTLDEEEWIRLLTWEPAYI